MAKKLKTAKATAECCETFLCSACAAINDLCAQMCANCPNDPCCVACADACKKAAEACRACVVEGDKS